MRTIRFAVAALCTLLATMQVALGAYLCRDEKGVTSYHGRGALRCVVFGELKVAGKILKTEYDEALELGVEDGEVKVFSVDSVQRKETEVTR